MAKIIIIILLTGLAIARCNNAYADDYDNYQAAEQRAEVENARISQAVDMQNMQNQMNQTQAPQHQYQQQYQQPQTQYQPVTTNTMYGTMYVGPGSGFSGR